MRGLRVNQPPGLRWITAELCFHGAMRWVGLLRRSNGEQVVRRIQDDKSHDRFWRSYMQPRVRPRGDMQRGRSGRSGQGGRGAVRRYLPRAWTK